MVLFDFHCKRKEEKKKKRTVLRTGRTRRIEVSNLRHFGIENRSNLC